MQPRKIIQYIDLTRLGDDNDADIKALCAKAKTPLGNVAAVCVYPRFMSLVKECLKTDEIKRACVINFPSGTEDINTCLTHIDEAITQGANEIDYVMPYQRLIVCDDINEDIKLVREACQDVSLKVILETGALHESNIIEASKIMIANHVDFIKTSTGKIEQGASIAAVKTILNTIKNENALDKVGVKVSGGVRTVEQAMEYIELSKQYYPTLTKQNFRIGASGLLEMIVSK